MDQRLITGEPVTLPQMLDAREQRQFLQQQMIEQYRLPLISFTLNIAGPVKVFPLAIQAYEEGVRLIQAQCLKRGLIITNLTEVREHTGYEAIFVLDADPVTLKQMAVDIETASDLGRLFDMDIIQVNGEKLSRSDSEAPKRQCLICDKEAFTCSRSRTHSIEELFQQTCEIIADYFL